MVEKKYKELNQLIVRLDELTGYQRKYPSNWFRFGRMYVSKNDIKCLKTIKSIIKILSEKELDSIVKNDFPSIFFLTFHYFYLIVPIYIAGLLFVVNHGYYVLLWIWAPFIIILTRWFWKWQTNEYEQLNIFIHNVRLKIDTDYYEKSDEYLQKLNAEKNNIK